MKFFFDYSLVSLGLFRSCAKKKVSCKKIMCVHMLRDTCHPALPITSHSQISLVKWWGQFAALIMDILHWLPYVWWVGLNRFKGCIVQHQVQTWLLLQSFRGWPLNHSSERSQEVQGSSVESMGPNCPAVVQVTPQIVSSLRTTVKLRAHNEPSGADPNDNLWFWLSR